MKVLRNVIFILTLHNKVSEKRNVLVCLLSMSLILSWLLSKVNSILLLYFQEFKLKNQQYALFLKVYINKWVAFFGELAKKMSLLHIYIYNQSIKWQISFKINFQYIKSEEKKSKSSWFLELHYLTQNNLS